MGLGGPLAATARSIRREGGASMMGSMVGSMAVAVVGGLWIFGIVEYDAIGIIGVAYQGT